MGTFAEGIYIANIQLLSIWYEKYSLNAHVKKPLGKQIPHE